MDLRHFLLKLAMAIRAEASKDRSLSPGYPERFSGGETAPSKKVSRRASP